MSISWKIGGRAYLKILEYFIGKIKRKMLNIIIFEKK